jgi:hypothetical protein
LQFSISGSIKKKVKINIGGSLYNSSYKSIDSDTRRQFGYSLNSSIYAFLPYDLKMRISSRLTGPSLQIQGERSGRFGMGLSLKRSFLKKILHITIYMRDIFRSYHTETILDTPEFYSNTYNHNISPLIGLRANIRLGKLKEMPKSNKSRENAGRKE